MIPRKDVRLVYRADSIRKEQAVPLRLSAMGTLDQSEVTTIFMFALSMFSKLVELRKVCCTYSASIKEIVCVNPLHMSLYSIMPGKERGAVGALEASVHGTHTPIALLALLMLEQVVLVAKRALTLVAIKHADKTFSRTDTRMQTEPSEDGKQGLYRGKKSVERRNERGGTKKKS